MNVCLQSKTCALLQHQTPFNLYFEDEWSRFPSFIILFSFPTALEAADFHVFHVMDIFCAGQLPTTHKPVRECTSPQWAVLADQSVAKANEEMKKEKTRVPLTTSGQRIKARPHLFRDFPLTEWRLVCSNCVAVILQSCVTSYVCIIVLPSFVKYIHLYLSLANAANTTPLHVLKTLGYHW